MPALRMAILMGGRSLKEDKSIVSRSECHSVRGLKLLEYHADTTLVSLLVSKDLSIRLVKTIKTGSWGWATDIRMIFQSWLAVLSRLVNVLTR